ncbi:MAG: hypothetical protein M1837_002600 [Sclerophora amabilis]|nr:MAG: hypothetical protein M1837_002600 [Sclerophora amabilis]
MKRKASELENLTANGSSPAPKRRASPPTANGDAEDPRSDFRDDLFEPSTLKNYKQAYDTSEPYPHHVISSLVDPALLQSVRSEIATSLNFTPKQTDIYRIHQTGDLANLSGLDSSSLSQLPSLLRLRNALYSPLFRSYLSEITGSGPLSGVKTDMAINVYTPGCHLLCHDDVIGSRRVSYILYLTDPAPGKEWKPEWGGALRLYPTTPVGDKGVRTPNPDPSVIIPPAFNQLSYFAVRPGESFHDVGEVFHAQEGEEHGDEDRVRMAISGWYHVPQKGEDGFVPGVQESWAEKSSLVQLQGKAAEGVDFPQRDMRLYDDGEPAGASVKGKDVTKDEDEDEDSLTEPELTFLLKYIAPTYLTPYTLSSLSSLFLDESSLRVESFLSPKFADRLKTHIEAQERDSSLPTSTPAIEASTPWRVARPPHKHRFLYQQIRDERSKAEDPTSDDPLRELLEDLFPSHEFRKWLSLATSSRLESYNVVARRFRRGFDYTLASGSASDEEKTQSGETSASPTVEITLGITPSTGWGDDEGGQTEDEEMEKGDIEHDQDPSGKADTQVGERTTNGTTSTARQAEDGAASAADDDDTLGGYEVYMAAGDDHNHDNSKAANPEDTDAPEADPAIYRSSTRSKPAKPSPTTTNNNNNNNNNNHNDGSANTNSAVDNDGEDEDDDEDDDGILFSMPAGWNRLSIVLRDAGVLRFVKYVSRKAPGDRWDVTGEFGAEVLGAGEGEDDEDGDEDGDEDEEEQGDEDEDEGKQ